MIQQARIQYLNSKSLRKGRYLIYWMQQSQRARFNHALEYAIDRSNELSLPLVVCFGLTPHFPHAHRRHYRFMLEGLVETKRVLHSRGIAFVLRIGNPDQVVVELARDAAMVIVDCGYLRIQRQWRKNVAEKIECPLVQVESDVIVPVEVASTKEEYSAKTFRPKIFRKLSEFLVPLSERNPKKDSFGLSLFSEDIEDIDALLESAHIGGIDGIPFYKGGTSIALQRLYDFIANKLVDVARYRNDPSKDCASHLSPYLHFGQISPIEIALEVRKHPSDGAAIFLEELIVRRELAINFVYYNPHYDSYECLPEWARNTLNEHTSDPREYVYTLEELEYGRTHDRFWNAAQREMVLTGYMHGYMRMYWAKKILEWSFLPQDAFERALYLNNKYQLDGCDPNSFAGVAWCFGKHDRPWPARPIFGKVRYMSDSGLKRKFDVEAYVRKVELLSSSG
ncbi:MAG: deoxyribodipyrimidine photo-lyase [Spirochaetes bacterium]|nr:deoxyribodipyrimidine photo-lyase [Spirochaetota bacterium]